MVDHPREITTSFRDWLAASWLLNPAYPDDRDWLLTETKLFSTLLFSLRGGHVDWFNIGFCVTRMYRELLAYRQKRSKTNADETLDGWLSVAFELGRGAASGML